MAKDIVMQKSPAGALIPVDALGAEYLQTLSVGKPLGVTISQARNYEFHKKIFALLGYLYDILPRAKAEYKGKTIEQSLNTFRRQMVALSGYYTAEATMAGTIRIEPQSLSYKDCSEELAKQIYSDLIDKALKLLGQDQSREGLDDIVNELLRFD